MTIEMVMEQFTCLMEIDTKVLSNKILQMVQEPISKKVVRSSVVSGKIINFKVDHIPKYILI